MPYITSEDKQRIDDDYIPRTAGELNYSLTRTILSYMIGKGKNYQTLNDILGALEGCKLEAYRRVVAPYEDKKIIENGDVY